MAKSTPWETLAFQLLSLEQIRSNQLPASLLWCYTWLFYVLAGTKNTEIQISGFS